MGGSGSTAQFADDDRSSKMEVSGSSSKRLEGKKVGRMEIGSSSEFVEDQNVKMAVSGSSAQFIDDLINTKMEKSGCSSEFLEGRKLERREVGSSSKFVRNQNVKMEVSGPSWKSIEEQMVKVDAYSSRKRKQTWYKDQFADFVLSMSLEEIFNDNLYINQVKLIPNTFEDVDDYLGSYIYPLMEETRAEFSSALEAIHKAPFAEVTSIVKLKANKPVYEVKFDYWRNKISDHGKEPYMTLPGDVVVLSAVRPETCTDLQQVGSTYTFALVQSITDIANDDDYAISGFKLKMPSHVDVEGLLRKSLYVVFLMNITTNKRIWNALHLRSNLKIIEHVLSRDNLDVGCCKLCSPELNKSINIELGSTLFANLDESQKKAIMCSISSLDNNYEASVQLIWGPPGMGKTKTLSILVYILLRFGVRTLICAPTDVAVSELATRVVKLVRDSSLCESQRNYKSCPLSDILILGKKEKLNIDRDVEKIFLDFRVNQLCLVPGWKLNVTSMISLLGSCISQYDVYLKNELRAKSRQRRSVAESNPKSLLEFAQEQFKNLVLPLRDCMVTFTTHLPRRLVPEKDVDCILKLSSLLDLFEKLLFQENMSCEKLKTIFLRGVVHFPDVRSRCLSMLRAFRSSIENIELPYVTTRSSIEEFCFRNASLVFCTTSSSHKLHHVNTKPFNLLVVDEAAQLKESELVIALQVPNLMHVILAGDEKQLPTTVTSMVSERVGYGRSLFERLSSLGHLKHMLTMQYRMQPSISWFPNSNFYNNRILDAPSVQDSSYERCYLDGKMLGPYSFIDIVGGVEQLDDLGLSRRNMVEVAVIVNLVQRLFKEWISGSKEKLSIGVISPYAAQIAAIQGRLKNFQNLDGFDVKVNSIDGFQGCEEDIIIISTVRANKGGSIGFLSSPRRTNVALTRARYSLWILGSAKTLSSSDSVWEALVLDAKRRQCFFTADEEDSDIAKTITHVKRDLDQLDEMLKEDSILFKNAIWKVIFSDNFRKSFKILNSYIKRLVINLLLKIASGWRPKKKNVDTMLPISSVVVKQFKVEDYFVVCSVDVIKVDSVYKQVLKVWDIIPVGWKPDFFDRLDNIFDKYTDEFASLCLEKSSEGNLEVPRSWSTWKEIPRFKSSNTCGNIGEASTSDYAENSNVSESLLLMKFYSLSNRIAKYLLSDHEGKEIDLPFEVTDEEREVILFPRSSFILGRSGTGKTTVLAMKLYRTLHQYFIACDDNQNIGDVGGNNLRQLFVSVSPKLCYAVKEYLSQLKRFANGDFSTNTSVSEMDIFDEVVEFKDIPDSFRGIKPAKYPLVHTFHKFTMMLDGTVGDSYFKRFHDVRGTPQSVALRAFIRKKEVTYERFQSFYWPHFNAKMTKNFDPSSVYTEIMSHIKGGIQPGEYCDTKLSRQDYISLANSRVSTLSAESRELIYNIFENYEKVKKERGEFDLADLIIDIHCRLKNGDMVGDKMDYVYIDEVQDLTMRQVSLFRHICKNVEEGFVFSGDTAQTIARGIDFRFEDIRSLFYSEFLMKSRKSKEKGQMSNTFCLSQNFRTHSGVLTLAKSVIDLIIHFFPQSIDVLAPETSFVYGEPPVLLEPNNDQDSIATIFGRSEKSDGNNWVGFGAEQVILVRDDSERDRISKYIGHQAIILTIVECKGLEFQDVLLYNFFGSSPISNQWRIVYEFLNEKNLVGQNCAESFPKFSRSRHNILCSELKQLYVAITRTRQRLWICEKNEEVSKPMYEYWRRLSLVQVRKLDECVASAMNRSSTPYEWKSQGIKLFWEKNYDMAKMCFEKAGEEVWVKRAKASGLREASDRLRDSNSSKALIMLAEAAELFASIGRTDTAAECFCDLGQYDRAGKIYQTMNELRKAGECFTISGSYKSAAEVYSEGKYYTECLATCKKGKYFSVGLQYIESWRRQRISGINIICQEFLESGAREFCESKDKKSTLKFVCAFHTMNSKRKFLKSFGFIEELLILEEENGNFVEAASIAKMRGDLLQEADLLGKGGNYAEAAHLVISYVLSNSLWISGSEGWPLKSFPGKEELLGKAMLLSEKVSRSFRVSICTEAEVLSHGQSSISKLGHSCIVLKQCESQMGGIFSILKLLDVHFEVNPEKYEWEHELHFYPNRYFDVTILHNQVSLRTLFSTWNSHKNNVLKILRCLDSIEKQDYEKCRGISEFCFKYFGLRMSDKSTGTHCLLIPDAEWIKLADKRFICQNRNVTCIDHHHFVLVARTYWRQELISVGLRVLETLQALYKLKNLSNYSQSICLIFIFNIAKFFIDDTSVLDLKKSDFWRFQGFVRLSMKYFEIVFPLDPRQCLSANMISLRESEYSNNLLEEVVLRDINTGNELTHKQIGRIVMIWLGSGKPSCDVLKIIVDKCSWSSSWITFIQEMDASHSLYAALKDVCISDLGTKNYISPHCLLYLVERLLIMVPHSRGYFYTTRSSFLEWLIFQESDSNMSASLLADERSYATDVFEFVTDLIHRFLYDGPGTANWIRQSNINWKMYHAMLVLRLVKILCLLCLNSEVPLHQSFEFSKIYQFHSFVDREFRKALELIEKDNDPNVPATSVFGAFKTVGDPILIVSLGEYNRTLACADVISLDLKKKSCKQDIIKTMFTDDLPNAIIQTNETKSAPEVPSMLDNLEYGGGKQHMQMNWELFRNISGMLESVTSENFEIMKSLFLSIKAEVNVQVERVVAALINLAGQRSSSDSETGLIQFEATEMIIEFKKLSSLMDTSEFHEKHLEILHLVKKLLSKKPQLDALLGLTIMQSNTLKVPDCSKPSENIQYNYVSQSEQTGQHHHPTKQIRGKRKKHT